jgi:hypothetical protein
MQLPRGLREINSKICGDSLSSFGGPTKRSAKVGMATAAQRYTYSGAHSAWVRACKRAAIADCRFNDMRAKALTDTEETDGMQAARRKGAHSTEQQTSDYVRHKKPTESQGDPMKACNSSLFQTQ